MLSGLVGMIKDMSNQPDIELVPISTGYIITIGGGYASRRVYRDQWDAYKDFRFMLVFLSYDGKMSNIEEEKCLPMWEYYAGVIRKNKILPLPKGLQK